MIPPHLSDTQLLDLVHELIDEGTRARVLEHAASCAMCEARLRDVVGSHERGRAQSARFLAPGAAPMAGAVERIDQRPPEVRRSLPASGRRWMVPALAAASILIVAGVAWIARSPDQALPKAAAARHVWLPSGLPSPQRRALQSPAESRVLAGIAAYDRRDLAAAESLLKEPLDDYTFEALRRVYLANTRVALDRPAEAAGLLEPRFVRAMPEPWAGEKDWTYAIVLAGTGHGREADSVLRVLSTRDDSIGVRARTLLDGGRRR